MFGFIIGFAGLAGLIWTLRRGRCHRRFGHHDHHGRHYRGWFGLGRLLRRIDASPAQEQLIRQEVDDFVDRARELFPETARVPGEVARAMRSKAIEPEWFDELFKEQERHLADLRKAFAEAISRVHSALTDEQREQLADLLERRARRGFGPYRSAA